MNDDITAYLDIIDRPHHESKKHPPMPMDHRAAQFSPFAAVVGHEEKLEEVVGEQEE